MGISGLLPLLKSITRTKHLSEYSGQTVAVDGYVWLHRGTYACAVELANDKPTHKYVDYAMGRVRLLRHYGITPYLVFDGGPLPAKKRTEVERAKRREENLAKGKQLAAQGRHSQAREYFVKCIDVTPQMAYQLIKALKAENVPYVVAPYEADAQLAYLERTGAVSAILTEDSDLLVFGCRHVLFKLDHVSATVSAVSRSDFGSLSSSDITLLGWSDVQFRAMAILSGCDYLPSIPGVGLKTAWALLRKHKNVENAVRALRLEGKKPVPDGYLDAFRLAEKVFLHQRVYDPAQARLVHLNDVSPGEPWDARSEAYVGADVATETAARIATGDVCPVSLLPMTDINPHYRPGSGRRPLQLTTGPNRRHSSSSSTKDKDKGKGKAIPTAAAPSPNGGLLHFFAPRPPPTKATSSDKWPTVIAGRESGKRTLTEVLGQDLAARRKRHCHAGLVLSQPPPPRPVQQSRFFSSPAVPVAAGPSRTRTDDYAGSHSADKENVRADGLRDEGRRRHEEDELDLDAVVFSDDAEMMVEGGRDGVKGGAIDIDDDWDDAPELSSPLKERRRHSEPSHIHRARRRSESESDIEVLSSPPAVPRQPWGADVDDDDVPAHALHAHADDACSAERSGGSHAPTPPGQVTRTRDGTPDLREMLGVGGGGSSSDIDTECDDDDDDQGHDGAGARPDPGPGPSQSSASSKSSAHSRLETPRDDARSRTAVRVVRVRSFDNDDDNDDDEVADIAHAHAHAHATDAVARGWWTKWALGTTPGTSTNWTTNGNAPGKGGTYPKRGTLRRWDAMRTPARASAAAMPDPDDRPHTAPGSSSSATSNGFAVARPASSLSSSLSSSSTPSAADLKRRKNLDFGAGGGSSRKPFRLRDGDRGERPRAGEGVGVGEGSDGPDLTEEEVEIRSDVADLEGGLGVEEEEVAQGAKARLAAFRCGRS